MGRPRSGKRPQPPEAQDGMRSDPAVPAQAEDEMGAEAEEAGSMGIAGGLTALQPAAAATTAPVADGDRNAVFSSLVKEDGDIVGLVAYSIYKQNKLDWLQAFEKARGRPPNEAEQAAYIIGESTPRRLAIYRHLADATLAGNGPEPTLGDGEQVRRFSALGRRSLRPDGDPAGRGWMAKSLIAYVVLAAAILVGVWLMMRFKA